MTKVFENNTNTKQYFTPPDRDEKGKLLDSIDVSTHYVIGQFERILENKVLDQKVNLLNNVLYTFQKQVEMINDKKNKFDKSKKDHK